MNRKEVALIIAVIMVIASTVIVMIADDSRAEPATVAPNIFNSPATVVCDMPTAIGNGPLILNGAMWQGSGATYYHFSVGNDSWLVPQERCSIKFGSTSLAIFKAYTD